MFKGLRLTDGKKLLLVFPIHEHQVPECLQNTFIYSYILVYKRRAQKGGQSDLNIIKDLVRKPTTMTIFSKPSEAE